MKLEQIRQFVALAETLNFHRAAERLNMTQPPLSNSLARLEAELGVRLFDRTQRRVEITEAGIAALVDARRVLFHAEQMRRSIQDSVAGVSGAIRLGFVGTATYSLLPRLLKEFRALYPKVELILEESWTTDLLDKIDRRELDFALVRVPVLAPTRVRLELVERDRFVVAVPAAGPLGERTTIDIRELKDQPLISYSRSHVPNLSALVTLMCQEAGFQPNVVQEAVQAQTILSLVESGIGIAVVALTVSRHSMDNIRFLTLTGSPHPEHLGLALALPPEQITTVAAHFRDFVLGSSSEATGYEPPVAGKSRR